jgi:DNA N-6-adenine-methyltransferase (Dam)
MRLAAHPIKQLAQQLASARAFLEGPPPAHKMPKQKPGLSKQDYSTPVEFLNAVKKRFGFKQFDWDLAATKENGVDLYIVGGKHLSYFGPDHSFEEYRDAFANPWQGRRGNLWLNPPYGHIEPWAKKCAESAPISFPQKRRIFFLVPASVGANWFAQYVDGKALVLFTSPRLSFDGKNPYPKDVLLACYGLKPGYECWRWK